MTQKKLESMSYRDLLKLQTPLHMTIETKRESCPVAVRNEIESLAQAAVLQSKSCFPCGAIARPAS